MPRDQEDTRHHSDGVHKSLRAGWASPPQDDTSDAVGGTNTMLVLFSDMLWTASENFTKLYRLALS